MVKLQGNLVNLRALELKDLTFLYTIENDESLWELSQTKTPFSKDILQKYLETAQKNPQKIKQLRLVITSKTNEPIGFIDLFELDSENKRAGVSIVILNLHRRNGFGKEALSLLIQYSFNTLGLHQVYSNVLEDNNASICLFESVGFEKIGLKNDWRLYEGRYKNEYLFQLINHVL
ncbi:MAG: GNAT family N-acetyltransferase [Flavobacteriaceae bacterium]|nr:GNAT family N-acetyltransferase [Flavobacteriaceae bacterium]